MLSQKSNFFTSVKIDFMKVHKINFFFSLLFFIASILLTISRGLNVGTDFAGGIVLEIVSPNTIDINNLRSVVASVEKEAVVQSLESKRSDAGSYGSGFIIKIARKTNSNQKISEEVRLVIDASFANIEYLKVESVGPQVGREMINKSIIALVLSFLSIFIYIWCRFNWQFGIGGLMALFHDAVITLGFFSLTQIEFNLTSIAAILTIIGYSINDSVVIYDRIRENIRKAPTASLVNIINSSINSTLSRTILTAGATIFSLLALIFFGGDSLFSFSLSTFFGIVIGTYSSIYISAPILFYFKKKSLIRGVKF